MAVARFLPTWLGGDCDHVDGCPPPPPPSAEGIERTAMPTTVYTTDTIMARPPCFCTGECRSNPCHPCNGGIGGVRTYLDGWRCPQCGNTYSPWVFSCPVCAPSPPTVIPQPDCGCGPNQVCNNTACPRRIVVTS